MAAPILPTADQLLTPGTDAIIARRPNSLAHFNNPDSFYSGVRKMWRAQLLVGLNRMAAEVKAARLRFATGQELRALCSSEFQTTLPPEPQLSFATVTLTRPAPSPGPAPAGVIPSGARTQFTKRANPDGIPLPAANAYPLPIGAATYNVVAPIYVAPGQLSITVQLVSVAPGATANVPTFTNYAAPTLIAPSKPLFDPTFVVTSAVASGGSSGLTDPVLVAAARAHAIGQFGPTDGAIIAGILEEQSARHIAAFTANGFLAYAQVYVSDESWASSLAWVSQVAQHFSDVWQGFGCRARFGTITNTQIAMAPTLVLASTDALNYTEAIDANVRAAGKAYFDDRPDWYSFRHDALQSALSKADPRILYCSGVSVTDAVTHVEVPDTSNAYAGTNVLQTSWNPSVTHLYLTDNGVTSTYLPPN